MDCEMVGVGSGGLESMLARCSIVALESSAAGGERGDAPAVVTVAGARVRVLYDRVVAPSRRVVDYRTPWSGMTRAVLEAGLPGAPLVSFAQCRREVAALLRGRVLVGHGLSNDFDALRCVRRLWRLCVPVRLSALVHLCEVRS